jgi:hypothetical protein
MIEEYALSGAEPTLHVVLKISKAVSVVLGHQDIYGQP